MFFNHCWKILGVCYKLQWSEDGTLSYTAVDGKGLCLICSDLKSLCSFCAIRGIYHFTAISRISKHRSRVSSRNLWKLHLNLIRQVHLNGFSAQYSSQCYCGWWRLQFQLNGMHCKLIDRQAVNCVLHSVSGNEQRPQFDRLWYETQIRYWSVRVQILLVWLTTCFWNAGKIPCMNDSIHMFAIVCAREELSYFTSQVGVGSRSSVCFAGGSAMFLGISVGVTDLRTSKVGVFRHSITASGVLSVDCLISRYFCGIMPQSHRHCEIARPTPEPLARAN